MQFLARKIGIHMSISIVSPLEFHLVFPVYPKSIKEIIPVIPSKNSAKSSESSFPHQQSILQSSKPRAMHPDAPTPPPHPQDHHRLLLRSTLGMLMFRDLAVAQEHSNQHLKSGVPKYGNKKLQQGEAFARSVLADSSLRYGRGCTVGQGVGLDVRVISRVAAGGGVRRESLQVDMDTLGSGPVAGRGFNRVPRCEGRPPVYRARVDLRTSVRPGLRSIRRARR